MTPYEPTSHNRLRTTLDRLNSFERWHIVILMVLLSATFCIIYRRFLFGPSYFMYLDVGSDTLTSYLPVYYHFCERIANGDLSFWSHEMGLGNTLFSVPQLVLDPVFLVFLFVGKEKIADALIYCCLLRTLLAGLFFFFYLTEVKVSRYTAVLISLLFAFNGYIVLWGQHYFFATAVMLGALVLFGFERMFQRGRPAVFVIAISIFAAFSVYFFAMMALYLALYAVFRYLSTRQGGLKRFGAFVIKTGGFAVLGLGISAASLFPQIWVLTTSERSAEVSDRLSFSAFFIFNQIGYYLTIAFRFFSNDLTGTGRTGGDFFGAWNYYELPIFYCGLLTLLLIPSLFTRLNRRKALLIAGFLLIGVFFIIFPVSNRIYFVYIYFELFLAAWSIDELVNTNTGKPTVFVITAMIILMVIGSLLLGGVVLLGWTGKEVNLALGKYALIACWLVGYVVVLSLFSKPRAIGTKKILLLLLVVGEMATFANSAVNKRRTVSKKEFVAMNTKNKAVRNAVKFLNQRDKSFFRVGNYTEGNFLNDSLIHGYKGVKEYNSLVNPSSLAIMKSLSTEIFEKRILRGQGESTALADLLSVKYSLVNERRAVPKGTKYLRGFENIHVLENAVTLPFALSYDRYVSEKRFAALTREQRLALLDHAVVLPGAVRNPGIPILARKISYIDPAAWNKVSIKLEVDKGVKVIANSFPARLTLSRNPKGAGFYLKVGSSGKENYEPELVLEAVSNSAQSFFMAVHWSYDNKQMHRSRRIGYFEVPRGKREHRIALGPVGPIRYLNLTIIGAGPDIVFDNISLKQRTGRRTGRVRALMKIDRIDIQSVISNRVRGRVSLASDRIVTFGIPFHAGWHLLVDDNETNIFRANIGMTAARFKAGTHKIELFYISPYWRIGFAVTLFSILISILLLVAFKTKNVKSNTY